MSAELIEDGVCVTIEDIGEGLNGEYCEDDPDDVSLLRFYIEIQNPEDKDDWNDVEDASYCTMIPTSASNEIQEKAVKYLMSQVKDELLAGNSIKKLCEKLSWISPIWFQTE